MFFYRFSPFCSGEKKYAKSKSGQRSMQRCAVGIDDSAGRRRLYRRKNQHACRLAYDKSLRIAVRQIGQSHTIPKIRLGRMD